MKSLSILLIAFILTLAPSIISANEVPTNPTVAELIADGGSPETAVVVGEVVFWNNIEYVYVQYKVTEPSWCLTKTNLHVADEWEMVPQTKKNNPIPGKFDYQAIYDCVQMSPVMMIPRDYDLCTELVVAAHAQVEMTVNDTIEPIFIRETAWAAGKDFPGKNWATYFNHTITEPEECFDEVDNDCDGLTDDLDEDCMCPCWSFESLNALGWSGTENYTPVCLSGRDIPNEEVHAKLALIQETDPTVFLDIFDFWVPDDPIGIPQCLVVDIIEPENNVSVYNITEEEARTCREILLNSELWASNCSQ
jgi:hypothetical protein